MYDLNEKTFLVYAMHCYENPHCISVKEFEEDLKRYVYIKRLFSRYRLNNTLNSRLVINHIIIMRNMFGVEGVVRLLFFSIDDVFWDILIPFLDYLKYLPDVVYSINGKNIHINNYEVDSTIIQKLKEIDEQTNF